jgi:hypothetical protein
MKTEMPNMVKRIRAHAIKEKGGMAEPFSYERALGEHDVVVRITHCSIARGRHPIHRG